MSCAIRHIVREPFVWKTKPGACEVEPPVSEQRALIDHEHVGHAELREVIRRARADDARADDHRLRPVP